MVFNLYIHIKKFLTGKFVYFVGGEFAPAAK